MDDSFENAFEIQKISIVAFFNTNKNGIKINKNTFQMFRLVWTWLALEENIFKGAKKPKLW